MTTSPARTPRSRPFAPRLLLEAAVLQARIIQRNPASVVVVLVQPVVFAGLGLLAAPASLRADPNFAGRVLAGSALVAVWAATLWTSGQAVRRDRRDGTITTAAWTGADLPLVFLGRAIGATAFAMLGSGVASTVTVLAFESSVRVERPLVALTAYALTTANVVCLGFLVGAVFVATRAAPRVAEALTYPVFVLGGFYIPLEHLPPQLTAVSVALGPYWGGRLLHVGLAGGEVATRDVAMVVALAAAYLVVGLAAFERVLIRARDRGTLDLF